MAMMKKPSTNMTKAKQAINKDDSRGARMRKVNAERIKAGKPKRKTAGAAKKQSAMAGQMNRQIKKQQGPKPY